MPPIWSQFHRNRLWEICWRRVVMGAARADRRLPNSFRMVGGTYRISFS